MYAISTPRSEFLDADSIINKQFYETIKEMIICVICQGICVDPYQCTLCENSFCKSCINNWQKASNTCPFKCPSLIVKEGSRPVRNLLDKLIFMCPNLCNENTNNFSYENIIKHLQSCKKLKIKCPTCSTLVSRSDLEKDNYEKEKMIEKITILSEENEKLTNEKNDYEEEIKRLRDEVKSFYLNPVSGLNSNSKSLINLSLSDNALTIIPPIQRCNTTNLGTNNNLDKRYEQEMGLIDKCEHFKGNYKPIFICCNKAYPCYICHNEKQNDHSYEFSNKVVCLLCNNIYTGSKCNQCNAYQLYRKK